MGKFKVVPTPPGGWGGDMAKRHGHLAQAFSALKTPEARKALFWRRFLAHDPRGLGHSGHLANNGPKSMDSGQTPQEICWPLRRRVATVSHSWRTTLGGGGLGPVTPLCLPACRGTPEHPETPPGVGQIQRVGEGFVFLAPDPSEVGQEWLTVVAHPPRKFGNVFDF